MLKNDGSQFEAAKNTTQCKIDERTIYLQMVGPQLKSSEHASKQDGPPI